MRHLRVAAVVAWAATNDSGEAGLQTAVSCASPFYCVAVELSSRTQKYAPLRFSETTVFDSA